jgi:hypothetical protein
VSEQVYTFSRGDGRWDLATAQRGEGEVGKGEGAAAGKSCSLYRMLGAEATVELAMR